MGQYKHEVCSIESKFIGKKCYYNLESASPLVVDYHARGISLDAIRETLCENYGVSDFSELPPDAFADAFSDGYAYATPATVQVRGGRLRLYISKVLTRRPDEVFRQNVGGYVRDFTLDENGNLIEL